MYDLVNRELLPEARTHLAVQGFEDILLIIDDLDKIPQKVLSEQGLTNHENLFLDNASKLRAISCSLLMTIPIELAYSPAQGRLRDDYGAAISTIPLVTVADRRGDPVELGERALAEVVGRRARVAFGEPTTEAVAVAQRIFVTPADLHRVLCLSGGHLRSLLIMLTALLDWVDELPVPTATVDRYLARAAKDMARGALPEAKDVLRTVDRSKEASSAPRFFDLLRNFTCSPTRRVRTSTGTTSTRCCVRSHYEPKSDTEHSRSGGERRRPGAGSHNLAELAALKRMIRRSHGFRITFAVANHPALQAKLAGAVRRDLPDVTIAELTVVPGATGRLVAVIEGAAAPSTGAVFVLGLDRLGSARARCAVTAELNLNRDYLWRTVRVPVVLCVADFVVREFAHHATDLWSGRSGVYRFRPEGDDRAGTVADVASGISWSRTPEERREREALLRELLDELDETGNDVVVRAPLLAALGDAATIEGRPVAARDLFQQALPTYREIGDRLGEAHALRSLGDVALFQSRYEEARDLYQQALATYREVDDRMGEAQALRSLGDVALFQGRYEEARDLYQQALVTYREIGDRRGAATALRSLGDVARMQGRYAEARDLHQQALPTYMEIGDHLGAATALRSLGEVARLQGRYAEAWDLYQQALPTYREIGDRLGGRHAELPR